MRSLQRPASPWTKALEPVLEDVEQGQTHDPNGAGFGSIGRPNPWNSDVRQK